MISPLRKLLWFVSIATVAIVCAENLGPQSFIRKRGTYIFDASGSSIAIITAKDNKPSVALDFRSVGKNSTNSSHMSFDETGILREGWFVFIESTNRVWIFDGKSGLSVGDRSGNSTKFVANIESDAKAAAVCPLPVKEALPKEVLEKLFGQHPRD
jgi:hypothetical protein